MQCSTDSYLLILFSMIVTSLKLIYSDNLQTTFHH
uniref:Uncharacterized protein n=1 Tax=Anopheles quadriannulatus TaxID=34691 RepID=A0A182XTB3_ANOQN